MFDPKKGGEHLGCVRNWSQWNAANGEYVSWGSDTELRMRRAITPKLLEDLACDIATAALREITSTDDIQMAWQSDPARYPEVVIHAKKHRVNVVIDDEVAGTYLTLGDALKALARFCQSSKSK